MPSKKAARSSPPQASPVGAGHVSDTAGGNRPISFLVPGQRVASRSASTPETAASAGLPGVLKDAVRVNNRRAGGGGEQVRVTATPGEDVVVLRIAGGPALVLHPENARDLMLGQGTAQRSASSARSARSARSATGPADGGDVVVPAQLRWRGLEQAAPTRSGGFLGEVLLQAFEVVTGLFKDKAVDFVASQVVAKVDGQVDAGVYALQRSSLSALKGSGHKLAQVPGAAQPASQPLLVLIHGTFVDTFSTFGKLWALHPQRVGELFDHYGDRVYALDHPTVGVSPIANALTLVAALPAGARLHLATHSRGGLVAEVLARVAGTRAVSDEDLVFFPGPEHAAHRRDLQALAAAVRSKNIQVDRVLRVACPARGTLLASQRLDAYLSVLRWTLEVAGVPALPVLLDFLTEVARRRASPTDLPGLASMIPDTPLVNWLNASENPVPGDLRVVAGDLQGDSIGSWLKTLLADSYYWTDNDIVVQTRSMYGGSPRAAGATFLLDQGGKSTHFNYFANERSVQAVVSGLTQDAPSGFRVIGPLSWAGEDASGQRAARRDATDTRAASDKPAVFVIPGILGSHLKAGDKRIWLSLRLVGGLGKLAYRPNDADGVKPDGPVGAVYDDLIEHLAASHEVIPFGFDWRRPIEEEARRLALAVEQALDARNASGQPVRIIAHSMGGVLTRTLLLERRDTFERLMQREGARVLMLGTPNGGSWAPMQVLSGDDTFGNALASFGSPLRDRQARQWMAEMPGFLQLQAGLNDPALALDKADTWAKLARDDLQRVQDNNWWHRSAGEAGDAAYAWGVPTAAVLQQALALRQRLDHQRDHELQPFADRMLLVVGHAKFTPDGFEWGNDGFAYLNATDGGDGRVPLKSALLPGVRTWTLDSEHGSMPDVSDAFAAYVELLVQGDTTRLPRLGSVPGAQPVTDTRSARSAAPAWPAATVSASVSASVPAPVAHVRSRPSRGRPSALPAPSERGVFASPQATATTAADGPAPRALRITVLNGNLSFVHSALMVGHTRSLALTGTEAAVNGLIGGGMKQSLDAGLYPDATGTHQIFVNRSSDPDNPWRAPQPRHVLVAGLGEEGKLTETELTHTVRQAVIAWSQRLAESGAEAADSASPGRAVELCSTLMGSGGVGMHTSNAARAIALGVRQANQRLSVIEDAAWPVIEHLTLVELYLERASDAWNGLQVLAAAAPGLYDITPTIPSGVGPLRRQIDSGYRGADYDFIVATSNAEDVISFALDTKRARTEVRAQSTQGKLLRELVKRASTETNQDTGLGRTLFQLLVPTEVEPFLAGTSRMLLELDDKTASIPWEVLDTRGENRPQHDDRPWAIRTRLLRKLRQEHFRQQVQDAQPDDAVLVVGEPKVNPKLYAALPGARSEALAVRDLLVGHGGLGSERVIALVQDNDASQIINALFERRYRIVHIAGHGEPVKRSAKAEVLAAGGVVLSDDTYLGPNEIRSMRTVPELVFVNCCHLAARDSDQTLRGGKSSDKNFNKAEFAWGVADSLIEIGVRCVIAAGWAVDDLPAKVFAQTFYREILNRRPFIDAVATAREAAWNEDRDSNTWAAYQAYGDPNWVYRRGPHDAVQSVRAPREEFDSIASPLGLALALEEQAVKSKWMRAPSPQQLEKIRHLQARFEAAWGGMGAVAEAFAVAYFEAGDRDAAITWYQRALASNDGSASMKAQEKLGNLRARRGWDWARTSKATDAAAPALVKARDEILAALKALQGLASLQPTVARESLCGSAWKRLALLERQAGDDKGFESSLTMASQAYARAEDLALAQQDPRLFYPALNRMALQFVLQARDPAWKGFVPERTAHIRRSLLARVASQPDFESHVGLIEIDLYEALARRQLVPRQAALLDALEHLHDRAPSSGLWSSVADQSELVLSAYQRHATAAERACAQTLSERLRALAKASRRS
jgi:CHAT domain-containing protein